MRRRAFLQLAGASAGAVVLAACGASRQASAPPVSPSPGPTPAGAPDAAQLNVIPGSFYPLTGSGERVSFGLSDLDNTPLEEIEAEVRVRDVGSGEIQSGPFPATFHDDLGEGYGLYVAHVDLPAAGAVEIVVDTEHGSGVQTLMAVDPADSELAVPGDDAVAVATPTADADLGVNAVCTQNPPCGMHEVSLEDALAEGRPVVLLFATPAYCQTVVCGPAVATLDEVRAAGDWGDAVFVHAEIYRDEGSTTTESVQAWGLPSEPWLFGIDAQGKVTARVDGAILASDAEAVAQGIA